MIDNFTFQCSANSSLFANNSQIDLLQIYLLIFRSKKDSYSPHFHVMNIIPIRKYYNFRNFFPIHKFISKYYLEFIFILNIHVKMENITLCFVCQEGFSKQNIYISQEQKNIQRKGETKYFMYS